VGFVNPTLYKHPEVLHDITVGSNPGCGTNGFAVARGWDPGEFSLGFEWGFVRNLVSGETFAFFSGRGSWLIKVLAVTGLGTPDYPKMLSLFLSLP